MREEPIAFLIEHDGTGYGKRKRVMLAETYDPRKPEFWRGGVQPASHTFTPLYTRAKPPQPADDNHKALVEALMNSAVGLEYMAANRGGKLAREFKDQAAKNRALIAAFQSRQEEK